jgi:hypothetical protein
MIGQFKAVHRCVAPADCALSRPASTRVAPFPRRGWTGESDGIHNGSIQESTDFTIRYPRVNCLPLLGPKESLRRHGGCRVAESFSNRVI